MILTDDNFATIVTAVEGGRALYDNLMKYVRVQMIMLAGFILTFVGAGIFDIANGAPLLPLQILWINFADRRAARLRARLRCRHAGADAAQAEATGRTRDRRPARRAARIRRPAAGDRHAARRRLGRGSVRSGGRHHDGPHDDLAAAHRRRPRVARPLPQHPQLGHARQPTVQPADSRCAGTHLPRHDGRRPATASSTPSTSTATSGGRASSPSPDTSSSPSSARW